MSRHSGPHLEYATPFCPNISTYIWLKSFANIAKATPDQLRNLPGFGQVKVKNIKNTFDKPLRNNATRTLPVVISQQIPLGSAVPSSDGQIIIAEASMKGKEKEVPTSSQRSREPSPIWDIELDLNDDGAGLPLPASHPFDIDLDLN